jgi:hypothetical protein
MSAKQALEIILAVLTAIPLPLVWADWLKLQEAVQVLSELVESKEKQK